MINPHLNDETIIDRLCSHAESMPDCLAFRFLHDDGESEVRTFGQLAKRVRGIAAHLLKHAAPGDRALLMYPPGLEFVDAFLACLAANIIAIPAYPPRANRKAERQWGILEDALPRLTLISTHVYPQQQRSAADSDFPAAYLVTDEIIASDEETWPPVQRSPDSAAFLQYTSGSTSAPRGVIVTHGNLMANELAIQAAFGHSRNSVVVGWLPFFHDMGLIGNILQPLYVGFPAILFSATSFVREPLRWLRAITEYRATTSGAPNFAYDHCVRLISDEQKRGLDLRCWCTAYNGSEPIRADTLDRFAKRFADCGFQRTAFFTCYGLAEATLFVSGGSGNAEPERCWVDATALEAGQIAPVEPGQGRCLVASGVPADGTKVVAIDPTTLTVLAPERVGEIWVSSPSVAKGYWALESETTFDNYLADGEGPFLNTGDLGFMRSGQVYITGRTKDLIILGGRNIYPQDVEYAVQSALPGLGANSCAAFAVERGRQERLVIVVEADRELVRSARQPQAEQVIWSVIDKICHSVLTDLEAPVGSLTFVRPGTFLRTSSGKLQRGAIRTAFREGTLDAVFAWDANEPHQLARGTPVSCSFSVGGEE